MDTPLWGDTGGHTGTASTKLHHIFPHKQNNHLRVIHPNDINHSTPNLPKRNRRGGACVPARTSAQRRFHTKNTRIVRGEWTTDGPCRATRAGTQAPPLPISVIHPRTIIPNDINHSTPNLPKRNRRGGACVPARTSAQRRFHTKNTHTHRKRKYIAYSRPHYLK